MPNVPKHTTKTLPATTSVPTEHADWFAHTLADAMPPATRRAYRLAAKGIAPHSGGEVPDDGAVLARVRELDAEGKSASAMTLCVSAAKHARRLAGLPALGDAPARAVAAIRKARRREGDLPSQVAPLRSAQLDAIEAAGEEIRPRETPAKARERANLDMVMIRLARVGLMRVSELVRTSLDDLQHKSEGGATLTFRRSKGGEVSACVIGDALLRRIHAVRREPGDRRIVPLSVAQVRVRMRRAAAAAGIEGVSTHSARVGMARDLTSRGASLVQIQLAGNWRSPEMPARYARRESAEEGVVARMFPDG